MQPRIEIIEPKKLVGLRLQMSLSENKTGELWRNFMPRRGEILHTITNDLLSLNLYNKLLCLQDIKQEFEKWACVEVPNFDSIPVGMHTYILEGGLYAVFQYIGLSTDTSIFYYIYDTWLPQSNYELDYRPQFEVLGENYKNNDPNSEEEIWVPIKSKVFVQS